MMNNRELLNALETIKKKCAENEFCSECPLRHRDKLGKCYLNDKRPAYWQVKQTSKDDWRAFYD